MRYPTSSAQFPLCGGSECGRSSNPRGAVAADSPGRRRAVPARLRREALSGAYRGQLKLCWSAVAAATCLQCVLAWEPRNRHCARACTPPWRFLPVSAAGAHKRYHVTKPRSGWWKLRRWRWTFHRVRRDDPREVLDQMTTMTAVCLFTATLLRSVAMDTRAARSVVVAAVILAELGMSHHVEGFGIRLSP